MNPAAEHMTNTLKALIHVLQLRNSEVEQRMGRSGSLGRLLAGRTALKFEHILEIACALGMSPAEVFGFAYPDQGEPSEAGRRVREATGSLAGRRAAPEPTPPGLTEDDVERIALRALRRALG